MTSIWTIRARRMPWRFWATCALEAVMLLAVFVLAFSFATLAGSAIQFIAGGIGK